MSTTITETHIRQFADSVILLAQQRKSRLRDKVKFRGDLTGKMFEAQRLAKSAMQQRVGRHADTPLIEQTHDRRWGFLDDYEWADLIDTQDRIRALIDPESAYVQSGSMAAGRQIDDVLISAATGTAYSGENGGTSNALPAAQQIANGGTGLTVDKLRTARETFNNSDLYDLDEPCYLVHAPKGLTNLLETTEVISSDYNTIKALVRGDLNTFMGFEFVKSTRLAVAASIRTAFAWYRSGLHLGMGKDVTVRVSERADKGYATQVYVCLTLGAMRAEDEKVVQIDCSEV